MKRLFAYLLLAGSFLWGNAQQDSIVQNPEDSALQQSVEITQELISDADSIHLADSLEMIRLTERIANLRAQDQAEKERLQASMDSLQAVNEARKLAIKKRVDSLRATVTGIPVDPFGDTILYVFSKLGPFSPSDRVHSIENKLLNLVSQNDFHSGKLRLVNSEESSDILVDDIILLSITDKDAFWVNKSREEAAADYLKAIQASVDNYFEVHSLQNTLLRIGLLVLSILLLIALIYGLRRLFSWIRTRIENKQFKPIQVKGYEFFTSERIKDLSILISRVLSFLLHLLIFYLVIPLIFSIFPGTRGFSAKLFSLILTPLKSLGESILGFIPNLITIVIIVMVTRYLIRILRFFATEVERGKLEIPGFYPDWAKPTLNLVRFILYAFMFVVIFPYLPGSDSPIFQGVSVFLGLLISLGSSSAISNVVAGLVITYMRPYKRGDRVKIGDTVGDVIEKNLLVTRVRTIKNEEITIPNANILSGHTINYSTSADKIGLILHTTVTIGYDVPWKQVEELLINAALKVEMIERDPSPFVLQTSLDDFYVSYQLNAFTKKPAKAAVIYSQIHQQIQEMFNEAGVEILSPHYRAARDGNQVTLPPDYLPEDYIAPSFRITGNAGDAPGKKGKKS